MDELAEVTSVPGLGSQKSGSEDFMLLQTVAEAAQQLGLTTERVRQLTRAGTLKGVKTPYGYLYEPTEVLRLSRERKSARQQQTA